MAMTATEKHIQELEHLKAVLESPTKEDDQAAIESRMAELERLIKDGQARAARPKPVRKKVNLDKELAKKQGTFAVGIQAAMRDIILNKGR